MTNLSNLAGFQIPTASAGNLLGTIAGNLNGTTTTGASNPAGSTSYSGFLMAAAPTASNLRTRNTFAHWCQWRSPNSNASGHTMTPFDIDRQTGAVSLNSNGSQNVWYNSSGSALSTTYMIYDPTHGCFFSGGHNAYPGYTSHQFGYTYGVLSASGSISGGGQYTGADHGYNGSFCGCLPSASGGTNYMLTGGYQSYAGGRVITCSAGSINVGGWSQDGSWTSSSAAVDHVFQPDHQGYTSGETVSMGATSQNNPNYKYAFIASGSTSRQISVSNLNSTYNADVFGHSGGNTLWQNTNGAYAYNSSNGTFTSLVNGYPDFLGNYQYNKTIGVGDDCYLYMGDLSTGVATFFQIDSNRQPTKVQNVPIVENAARAFLPSSSGVQYFVVYQNDNDVHPKWLVSCSKQTGFDFTVQVEPFTADFAALKA